MPKQVNASWAESFLIYQIKRNDLDAGFGEEEHHSWMEGKWGVKVIGGKEAFEGDSSDHVKEKEVTYVCPWENKVMFAGK